MLKKILPIIIFFISTAIWAQNTPPQASSVMEKTVKKYNALAAFIFDFNVNVDVNDKNIRKFDGMLWVKKEKYFLSFEDQTIANDSKTLWNYQKSTNEASLFESEDDEFSMFHPTKLLNNWNSEYYAKVIREEMLQKNKVIIVDLTPKKQSTFYKLRLFIDNITSYIHRVMMYEPDGTTITYSITKFTSDAQIADDKFTFNKKNYPDVQVNDMR